MNIVRNFFFNDTHHPRIPFRLAVFETTTGILYTSAQNIYCSNQNSIFASILMLCEQITFITSYGERLVSIIQLDLVSLAVAVER